MRLSSKAIEDFKKIYKEEFGKELSTGDAEVRALGVLRVFQILLSPPTDQTFDKSVCDGRIKVN